MSDDKRYRRTGTLVFSCIGFVVAFTSLVLLLVGIVVTGRDVEWGSWLVLVFLAMWALDKADDVKDELNKPPYPRFAPPPDDAHGEL